MEFISKRPYVPNVLLSKYFIIRTKCLLADTFFSYKCYYYIMWSVGKVYIHQLEYYSSQNCFGTWRQISWKCNAIYSFSCSLRKWSTMKRYMYIYIFFLIRMNMSKLQLHYSCILTIFVFMCQNNLNII